MRTQAPPATDRNPSFSHDLAGLLRSSPGFLATGRQKVYDELPPTRVASVESKQAADPLPTTAGPPEVAWTKRTD